MMGPVFPNCWALVSCLEQFLIEIKNQKCLNREIYIYQAGFWPLSIVKYILKATSTQLMALLLCSHWSAIEATTNFSVINSNNAKKGQFSSSIIYIVLYTVWTEILCRFQHNPPISNAINIDGDMDIFVFYGNFGTVAPRWLSLPKENISYVCF